MRAELHRLRATARRRAGHPSLPADGVASDLAEVQRCLAEGRLAAARELDQGPLLPGSKVPAIIRERTRLAARLQALDHAASG